MQLVTSFSGDRAVTHIAEQRTQSHIQYSLAERPQLTQFLTLSFATPVFATQPWRVPMTNEVPVYQLHLI